MSLFIHIFVFESMILHLLHVGLVLEEDRSEGKVGGSRGVRVVKRDSSQASPRPREVELTRGWPIP